MRAFIPISSPSIGQKEVSYVTDAVSSGWVSSLGPYIDRFERDFASFCGTRFALATSNGTTALHLALVAAGIGPGDEVLVPDFTFVATANAVTYTGAVPVLVDIDAETLCIDPDSVAKAITPRTRAIIPVHIFGHPAPMNELNRIASENGLLVIEDAAEAHGAECNGKRVGSLGLCGTFSFYGNKIITSGEGGMVTTDDETLYQRMRHLRDHAMAKTRRYWHEEVGYNYRMTNLQAALGVAQLERIDELIARRREVFKMYRQKLGQHPCLQLNRTAPWATNVYWMVCVEISGMSLDEREVLMTRLREKGVDSRPYFYPLSAMPMYASGSAATPVAHRVSQEGLCLPSFFEITDQDVAYVCETLLALVGER